jgi:hypothetical protein
MPTVEQLRASSGRQSDYEICRAVVMGNPSLAMVAGEEQARRSLNCQPYMASIQMRMQNEQANNAMALQLLQMSRPQPYMLPMPAPSVNCVSRPSVGSVYTTCN